MARSPAPPPPAAERSPGLAFRLGALVLAALVHRIGIAVMTATISSDSAHYLWCAQTMAAGAYDLALGSFAGLHPLYPLLIACAASLTGDAALAGTVVSILAGSAAVVPLYVLVRIGWNERVAFWTACLYAADPTFSLETADIMTTGLYLTLFLSAMALFVSALRRGRVSHALMAGLAAGGAYLTRPEGILLPILFVAGTVATLVRLRRDRVKAGHARASESRTERTSDMRLVWGLLAAIAAFGLLGGPYILWMRSASGRWLITMRPVHSGLVEGVKPGAGSGVGIPIPIDVRDPLPGGMRRPGPERDGSIAVKARPVQDPFIYSVVKHVGSRLIYPPFAPLLLIGLWSWRRQGGRPVPLILLGVLTGVCWIPPILASAVYRYPLSHRYLLPGMLFVLPWMAAGVATLMDQLAPREGGRWRPALRVTLLLMLVCSVGIKTWKPHRWDEAAYLEAGRWVSKRTEGRGGCRVAASRDKIAYYAGARLVKMPRWDDDTAAAGPVVYAGRLRRIGAAADMDYLLYDERTMEVISDRFHEILMDEGFVPVARFPSEETDEGVIPVRIYRLPGGKAGGEGAGPG